MSNRLNIATYKVPRSPHRRSRPEDVAAWLRQFPAPLEDIPIIADLLAQDPQLAHALQHSAAFYAKQLPEDATQAPLPAVEGAAELQRLLTRGMVEGRYPGFTLAVFHHGRMWLNPCVESLKKGSPCSSDLHRGIRQTIYALLGRSRVTEYGRQGTQFGEQSVLAAPGTLSSPIAWCDVPLLCVQNGRVLTECAIADGLGV